ncbi:MAG: hypothetical protein K6G44_02845 [Lentisphaeria bacterium]|nr:hypothetical protein [Lentisphaeria bacterium]
MSQSTDSDGLAVGYVKREKTLFFDGYDSLLWVITPPIMGRNDIKTQYFKPLWGICNHGTEKICVVRGWTPGGTPPAAGGTHRGTPDSGTPSDTSEAAGGTPGGIPDGGTPSLPSLASECRPSDGD